MLNSDLKLKLQKSVDFLKTEISQIRTGRASPSLLEDIAVEAYGSKMKVKELGSISSIDPQNLVVSPWDKGLATAIAAAIRDSDLKVNPIVDNGNIRVPIPSLTEDRRKEFVKIASQKVEEAKNAMRNIRQEAMKDIDKEFLDKKLGEDEKFTAKDVVEKTVKEFVTQADDLGEEKKTDLMRV
ncbi:MAG: hypothetical protein ACD_22C00251G0004 [uncultured bacterium]|nr:MAG: hypothetical protein ACD_22C00251G0004 [uncultured bacterium]